MILQPTLARLVLAGKKTVTRRLVKPDETTSRYLAGRAHAVQPGRGRSAICRVLILDVHQENAGEITFDGARAEGFPTTAGFKGYWLGLHDRAWLEAWNGTETEENILERFEEKHAARPVWVISFALDTTEQPRLLAARSDELYVTNGARAMAGEPEAVDEQALKRIRDLSGMTLAQWKAIERAAREDELEQRSLGDRLERAIRHAKETGQSVPRDINVIEKRLQEIERRLGLRRAA